MQTVASRRVTALLGYVSLLAAAPLMAQIGPIQPVLITEGKAEMPHNRPDLRQDYTVPIDVYVAANGTVNNVVVSESTGDVQADGIAAALMRERKFLPAMDANGRYVESVVKVTVNMFMRNNRKVVRVTLKPPPLAAETERVRKLTCRDFIWEVSRIRTEAGIRDASLEVMPYLSARMYMQQKDVSSEVETKFWDSWPNALRKIIERCEKAGNDLFFTQVLVPALDGATARDAATVATAR